MTKVLLSLLLMLVITSCATAPKNWNVEGQRGYAQPYDKVWSAVVGFFAENSVPVKNMEKASGLIVAESQYFPAIWADCGGEGLMTVSSNPEGVFNVFVTEDDMGKVNVMVTTNFWCTRKNAGAVVGWRVECNSTGRFEKMILDHIAASL